MSYNLPGNKDQMHPEDMRNMFIFFIIAAILYMSADAFIFKPQAEAIKRAQLQAQQAQVAQDVGTAGDLTQPRDRQEIISESERVRFSNDHVQGSIMLKGGAIDDLSLKDYHTTLERTQNVTVLSPKAADHARGVEYGWVSADKNIKVPNSNSVWRADSADLMPGKSVTLSWDNGGGIVFKNTVMLDENYLFTVTQSFTNNTGKAVTLYPYGLISQVGLPIDYQGMWVSHEGPIGYIGGELVEHKYASFRKTPSSSLQAYTGWTGITDKYWLTALLPAQNTDTTYRFNRAGAIPAKKQPDPGRYQADFTGPGITAEAGQAAEYSSHAFIGAKKVPLLKTYGKQLNVRNFDLAVDFGWFWFLSKPFFWVLHFLHEVLGNMGVAIICLTIVIRSAVFPLTNLSYKSFGKMKKITPEIAALRDKHGQDKAALQAELVALYQREGVSPVAGCLPLLVQIPIFFALYKVLVVTIEMRHAPFAGWIHDLSAPDPTNIFNLFGVIPWDPPTFLHIGVWPCLMFVAFTMQKQLNPPPQDPIQRDMAMYFPFLMTYLMAKFAAGLVIYWTFSAFIGVVQQSIIMHRMGVPIHFLKSKEEKRLERAARKGVAVHPLMEMAEEKVEETLFGGDDAPSPSSIKPLKPRKKKKK
ncbi:MAG: membrane protein insertase YidC [Alphaproteobacteria bacterium]